MVLDHLPRPPLPFCRELRRDIRRGIGIPTSVGIASTKVLAKIAGGIAKRRPDGVFALGDMEIPGDEPQAGFGHEKDVDIVLGETPVEQVWGIAAGLAGRLRAKGIRTALDLKKVNDSWAREHITLTGLRIVWELRGIPSIVFEDGTNPKKGIMSSRSFGRPVTEPEELLEAVGDYTARAAARLRAQKSSCRLIDIWLTTNRFRNGDRQYSAGTVVRLDEATDYLPDLVNAARKGLKAIYRPGFRYKKVAVFLSGIESTAGRQTDLFRAPDPRKSALMAVADGINARYGPGALGCTSTSGPPEWIMRRERLSPGYTTRWDQLPGAKTG
jgi:DNA polymerase V